MNVANDVVQNIVNMMAQTDNEFLKSTFADAIENALKGFPFIKEKTGAADIDMLTSILLLSGIVGSAMITVPYNCLQTVVNDRENNVDRDILATPIRRWQIVLSYFSASGLSAILMNGIILTAGLIILGINCINQNTCIGICGNDPRLPFIDCVVHDAHTVFQNIIRMRCILRDPLCRIGICYRSLYTDLAVFRQGTDRLQHFPGKPCDDTASECSVKRNS